MEVSVRTDVGNLKFNASPLSAAWIVASAMGFHLDIEPMATTTKLTATHFRTGATIGVTGTSAHDVADKFISLLTNEASDG